MNKKIPLGVCFGEFFILRLGFDEFCERSWMFGGDLREDFAIECDPALLESTHERGVACAEGAGTGADADLLKTAVVALLEFAVDVSVVTGLGRGDLSESDAVLATPHHALGTGENILAALDAMHSTFYARHRRRLGK